MGLLDSFVKSLADGGLEKGITNAIDGVEAKLNKAVDAGEKLIQQPEKTVQQLERQAKQIEKSVQNVSKKIQG